MASASALYAAGADVRPGAATRRCASLPGFTDRSVSAA